MRIWKYLLTCNWVFKHKEIISNMHVSSNGVGKMWASYIFHFYKISYLHTYESILYLFEIIYDAMTNIHFSALDNVKMTCQTHMY